MSGFEINAESCFFYSSDETRHTKVVRHIYGLDQFMVSKIYSIFLFNEFAFLDLWK